MTTPIVCLPEMRRPSNPVDKTDRAYMDGLLARTCAWLRGEDMPEATDDAGPSAPAYDPAEAERKIRQLNDTVGRLVDEKAELTAANTRLAEQLKTVIAEKEELRRQLDLKSGMGIHENRPETLADIAKMRPSTE